jgi:hypothetical protein
MPITKKTDGAKEQPKKSGKTPIHEEALAILGKAGLSDYVKETKESLVDFNGEKFPGVYVLFDAEKVSDEKSDLFDHPSLVLIGAFLAKWFVKNYTERLGAKKTTVCGAEIWKDKTSGEITEGGLRFIQLPASYL